jgi:hypothetical protein
MFLSLASSMSTIKKKSALFMVDVSTKGRQGGLAFCFIIKNEMLFLSLLIDSSYQNYSILEQDIHAVFFIRGSRIINTPFENKHIDHFFQMLELHAHNLLSVFDVFFREEITLFILKAVHKDISVALFHFLGSIFRVIAHDDGAEHAIW